MNGEGRVVNGHGTGDTGSQPGLVGSRAHQSRSPVPALFRPETGSWHHRRFVGPARRASSRCQPRPRHDLNDYTTTTTRFVVFMATSEKILKDELCQVLMQIVAGDPTHAHRVPGAPDWFQVCASAASVAASKHGCPKSKPLPIPPTSERRPAGVRLTLTANHSRHAAGRKVCRQKA